MSRVCFKTTKLKTLSQQTKTITLEGINETRLQNVNNLEIGCHVNVIFEAYRTFVILPFCILDNSYFFKKLLGGDIKRICLLYIKLVIALSAYGFFQLHNSYS